MKKAKHIDELRPEYKLEIVESLVVERSFLGQRGND